MYSRALLLEDLGASLMAWEEKVGADKKLSCIRKTARAAVITAHVGPGHTCTPWLAALESRGWQH